MVHSLATGERHVLIEDGGGDVRYLRTGHLAFVRDSTLLAVLFDADLRMITEGPVPLVDGIAQGTNGLAQFALADDGTLVYLLGGMTTDTTLGWVNRDGEMVTPLFDGIQISTPRLSPDATRVAHGKALALGQGIVVKDLESGRETTLTESGIQNVTPVWTPDSRTVTFASDHQGILQLSTRPVDLSKETEPILSTQGTAIPGSWTPDGQTLVYYVVNGNGDRDIWRFPVGGEPVAFLATAFNERAPRLSPNGEWVAYVSDQPGQDQVLVQAFPEGGATHPVSTGPGTEPVWSRDGRELFYRNGDQMWAVEVETEIDFIAGRADLLFEASYDFAVNTPNYDVSLNGQQFLMVARPVAETPTLDVVLNWHQELLERVPVP